MALGVDIMGKRHKTLSDSIFRNSRYIKALEQELEISDFRKEYKEQYDIMLDIYKTLITINNIFFSDSNKSKKQKQNEIIDTLEKVIYKSIDDNRAKYSVRTIKSLVDKNSRLLYGKYNEWYEKLSYNDNYFDTLKQEVEEEMIKLENIRFDDVVKENINYQKNKNSNYKIYISKLGEFYQNNQEEEDKIKTEFKENYGYDLDEEQLSFISSIFDLVCYANNGITLLLEPPQEFIPITERSSPKEFYDAYLSYLNINYVYDRIRANLFLFRVLKLYQEINNGMPIDMFISAFDYFNFLSQMKDLINDKESIIVKNDYINKIISDLKNVYETLVSAHQSKNFNEYQEKQKQALASTQKIIDRNIKWFERVS